MEDSNEQTLALGEMAFYWRTSEPGNAGPEIVPHTLPFVFGFDDRHGLVIQRRDPKILEYLHTVYEADANIGFFQDGYDIALPYATDFIAYIEAALKQFPSIHSVLEIGCGGCMMLERLQSMGLKVLGVDPSPVALRSGAKKNVRVINDFFPSTQPGNQIDEKFDLVFHTDVLEHVENAVEFLKPQWEALRPGGYLIISLPDCSESVERGDVSTLLHQHLNYFDKQSLASVVHAAGFNVLSVDTAKYGGSLYCVAQKRLPGDNATAPAPPDTMKFRNFVSRSTHAIDAFKRYLTDVAADPRNTLGFYVPLRAIPYLAVAGRHDGFRVFDDTRHWHGRTIDGLPVPIENIEDLRANPVSHLAIMSLTFDQVIAGKVRAALGDAIQIKTLREFLP